MTRPELIVVGCSLGGLDALRTLVSALPPDFSVPIAVVQHRAPDSGGLLAQLLQDVTHLVVRDAEDKDAIEAKSIYIAPADYHLLVDGRSLELSIDERVNAARPSIDVLFESAAESYESSVVGVVLTGASRDGARGAAAIKSYGGRVLVQDPTTATSRVMPDAAIECGPADEVLTIEGIASRLIEWSEEE